MSDAFYLDAEPYKGGDDSFFLDAEPYKPESAEPRKLQSAGEVIAGGMTNLLQGLTFGAGDEIVAGGNALLDAVTGGPGYDARLKEARELSEAYGRENPVSGTLNSLAGLFAPIPNVMSKAKGLKAAAGNVVKGSGVGAAYGAGAGFLSGEGGAEKRLQGAAEGGKTGAALGAALSTAGEAVQGVGGRMAKAIPQLERKSVGARQSDYAKTAKDIGIIDAGDGLETTTKAALDDLLLNNKLGSSRDPQKILAAANENEKNLAGQVGKLISQADKQSAGRVVPTWEKALGMIESGQIPGEKIDSYLKRLEQIDEAIQGRGAGKLSYIQQQKVALGKMWDPNDGVLNEFNRALYSDLQKTVESVVPEVAGLNRELSKYKVVKPILQRFLAGNENANPLDKVISAIKTTGGYGTLITGATLTGGPAGFAGGLTTAAALRYLRTPQGQKLLAEGYKKGAPALKAAGAGVESLIPAISGKSQAKRPDTESEGQPEPRSSSKPGLFSPASQGKSSLFNPGGSNAGIAALFGGSASKKNGADMNLKHEATVEKLFPALVKQESDDGDPRTDDSKAVSNKGARGLSQIMPKTWAEWAPKVGVDPKKPFDPEANVKVGKAYLDWLLGQFGGDARLALAAYNYGIGNVKDAQKKWGKSFKSIYPRLPAETQAYVARISRNAGLA